MSNVNQKMNRFLGIESCCCFDLRIGGLIIGYIELVLTLWDTIRLLKHSSSGFYWMWNLLEIVIFGCWVYGIHEGRTAFMLPNLILSVAAYIICLVGLIIIPIMALGFQVKGGNYPETAKNLETFGFYFFYIIFILWAIVSAIQWFITSVKFSLYQQMKNDNYEGNGRVLSVGTERTTVAVGVVNV